MKPGYVLVQGNGLDALFRHVNDALKDGYRPLGAPVRQGGSEYGASNWWVQAMVLA